MRAKDSPATTAIVALVAIGTLVTLSRGWSGIAFVTETANRQPWTALTYPFAADLISAIVNGFTIWSFGRSVESDVGSARMAAFAAIATVLAAVGVHIGAAILGVQGLLAGPWMLAASMLLAWSVRYPNMPVRLMFLMEVQGKWLGILAVGFTLVAARPYELGLFAALALVFVWAFAAGKLSLFPYGRPLGDVRRDRAGPRGVRAPRPDYFDDVKRREKEREERERLRKLFEGSSDDDKPPS